MADLVRGKYHVNYPLLALTGQATNVVQPNVAPRSNLEFGLNGTLADTAAALTTQVMTVVPVPVEAGDTISKVTVFVGATAAISPTNQWAALYSGATTVSSAVLLGQSTDTLTAAIAASGALVYTLTTPQLIANNAPNGYILVAIMVKAGTVPSLVTVPSATAAAYRWYANGPQFLSFTAGSSLTGTAPATVGAGTAQSTAPVVFLT